MRKIILPLILLFGCTGCMTYFKAYYTDDITKEKITLYYMGKPDGTVSGYSFAVNPKDPEAKNLVQFSGSNYSKRVYRISAKEYNEAKKAAK